MRTQRTRFNSLSYGVLAMVGSGIGFYMISGIWRPFDPRGWDYAVQFLSWSIAYLPGFLALLVKARTTTLEAALQAGSASRTPPVA